MNRSHIGIIILVCLIPFLAYFARDTLWNTDTFYFAGVSCGLVQAHDTPILSTIFFEHFPCDEFSFKFLGLVLFIGSSLILAKIGELFSPRYGWLAPVIINLASYWMLTFTKIEDDLLAIPLLLGGLWFFVYGEKNRDNMAKVAAVFLTGVAGLFWKGSILFLLAYAVTFLPALIALLVIVFLFLNNNFGALVDAVWPNELVAENRPLIGIIQQWLLLSGFGGFFRVLPWQFWFVTLLAVANEKFAFILSLMLSLGLVVWLEKVLEKKSGFNVLERFVHENWKAAVFLWVGAMLLTTSYQITGLPPYPSQIDAVKDVVRIADGNQIFNDWSYGHYIIYYGGLPSHAGGGPDFFPYLSPNAYFLTERDLDKLGGCDLVRDYGQGFEENVKLYHC